MNLIQLLRKQIYSICEANLTDYQDSLSEIKEKFSVSLPKDQKFGDYTTNIAMILASKLRTNPRAIAEAIVKLLQQELDDIKQIDIAGAGFINLKFEAVFFVKHLEKIQDDLQNFGKTNLGKKQKINLEFGSPNPTGPIHVGHTRGSILGDVLAELLSFVGYDVCRENYFNDAGKQIDLVAKSLYFRYHQIAKNHNDNIPEEYYPGEYLISLAQKIYDADKDKYANLTVTEYLPIFKEIATNAMKELITADFALLGIHHDVNFSELSLHQDDKIEKAINTLKNKNLTYQGTLEKPKGKQDKNHQITTQLLFKSSKFGDDSDRAIARNDGSYTYFAADLAYHQDKISRGYQKLILILGADHAGYVKRIKAIVSALSDGKVELEVKLCQIVNYLEDGLQLKMSKRAGTYVTALDVVDKIGADALRFLMLTRKNDMIFDFDLNQAIEQSKDNPIFYVQYAHARICSVFRKAECDDISEFSFDNLQYLTEEIELDLIKQIMFFPEMITNSATNLEPHRISYYLHDLAAKFHSYWNLGKNSDLKFLSDNKDEKEARLILLHTIRHVIAIGLKIFNITPLNKMY